MQYFHVSDVLHVSSMVCLHHNILRASEALGSTASCEGELGGEVLETPFARAILLGDCEGTLLLVDHACTPMTRVWCVIGYDGNNSSCVTKHNKLTINHEKCVSKKMFF